VNGPPDKNSALTGEESRGGDAGCKEQYGDLLPCSAKTIKTMYNLARLWGFEDAAWNRESRKFRTRQSQRDAKVQVDRGISSSA